MTTGSIFTYDPLLEQEGDEELARDSISITKREEKRRSKYDLPLDYYDDGIKMAHPFLQRASKDRLSIISVKRGTQTLSKEEYYAFANLWNLADVKASIFKNLKTQILEKVISTKPNFKYVKDIAIEKLRSDIIKQLKILCYYEFCDLKKPWPTEGIPTKVFRWSQQDFMERNQFENDVWIDILNRVMTEKCLHTYKYQTDTEELIKYLNLIINSGSKKHPNFEKEIWSRMHEMHNFLGFYEYLMNDFRNNELIFHDECNKILALNFYKRESKNKYKSILQMRLMNAEFIDPIEVRYQLRYYDNKAGQTEMKYEQLEHSYIKKIEELKRKTKRDQYCSQCICNSIYVDVENYKNRFNQLNKHYDLEYERIDNKIQYMRLSIEKVQEHKKFMQEQLERFREEIELISARQLIEKAKEERLVMERLAAEHKAKEAAEKKREKKLQKKAKKESQFKI